MSNLFWLTEAQVAPLQPFFPRSCGKPRVNDKRGLSVIICISRNGLRWCDASREYGMPKTLSKRWKLWSDKGGDAAGQQAGLPAASRVPQEAYEASQTAFR